MALWYSLLIGVIFLHMASPAVGCPMEICTKTMNKFMAGTDQDVYVKMFADSGRTTPWIYLDDPNVDDFEQASYNCFDVKSLKEYGLETEIHKTMVRLLGQITSTSGWDLDYVTLHYDCKCRTYFHLAEMDAFDNPSTAYRTDFCKKG